GELVVAYTYHNANGDRDVSAWYRRVDGFNNVIQGTFSVAATTHDEYEPSAALNDYGRGVVAYTYAYSASDRDIHAQLISAQGSMLGEVSVGDPADTRFEYGPSVSMNSAGDFVIGYTHQYSATDQDARAQVFNSQGVAQGASFMISGAGSYDEFAPTVALGD